MIEAIKIRRATCKDDLYDALDNAMTSVKAAMDDLKGVPEYEDYYDTLSDLLDDMKQEFEPLEAWAQAQYDEEIRGLLRDYYRSVL